MPQRVHAAANAGVAPVLLVKNNSPQAPFGDYLAEILRAEGLAAFDTVALADLTLGSLTGRDVVVLAETALTTAQASTFTDYVLNGGRLIAMRPDPALASIFGLGTRQSTQSGGYLRIEDGGVLASGLTTQTMQIHGAIDLYGLSAGASVIARIYNSALESGATPFPAVVSSTFGSGIAVAFTYDLARNVAFIRQGNPARADVDVDGNGVRTTDLFQSVGGAPAWLDRTRIPIPQADEQQRLFARLVKQLVSVSRPLPQWWYFPGTAKSVLLLTTNTAANPDSYFLDYANLVSSLEGKNTFFLSLGAVLSSTVNAIRAQGHELGILPPRQFNDPTGTYPINNLTEGFAAYSTWFSVQFGFAPSLAYRTGDQVWEGWTTAAEIAANRGYRMDLSFVHYGSWTSLPDGAWPRGHIVGSGLPMRFVRQDGTVLPIYQQPTQISEQQLIRAIPPTIEPWSTSGALDLTLRQLDASLQRDYSALAIMTQLDYEGYGEVRYFISELLDYARRRSVPSLTASEWLRFVETRRGAAFSNITWNEATATLSFEVTSEPMPEVTLTVLLPVIYNGRSLQSVSVDGQPTAFKVDVVKAENQAFVSMPAGNHSVVANYMPDTPISGLTVVSDSPKNLGETMTFTATVGTGSNVTYLWDFGDGSFGGGATTTHVYRDYGNQGRYVVKVTAANAVGQVQGTIDVHTLLPPRVYVPMLAGR